MFINFINYDVLKSNFTDKNWNNPIAGKEQNFMHLSSTVTNLNLGFGLGVIKIKI
jgi:hypothetical protein